MDRLLLVGNIIAYTVPMTSITPGSAASLSGRTILMSGGSRGSGLAIAKRAAADGANIAPLGRTAQPQADE